MSDGLNKDGGISFSRKLNYDDKDKSKKKPFGLHEPEEEIEEEIEEPTRIDTEELLRQERLGAKLVKAKRIHNSGLAVNGGSIIGVVFFLDSFMFDPNTVEMLELINTTLGLEIDFNAIIELLQQYKAQIIGMCISFQTMLLGYKDTVKKMKERDTESFMEVVNDELGKVGI